LAIKTLGKDPTGSAFLASSANLSALLGFASTFKDDPEASSEALRCIANALLLIEGGRSTFIGSEVNGGEVCLTMLEVRRVLFNHQQRVLTTYLLKESRLA